MSLCASIDTLAMAYLDDELAAEERREVELHTTECAACRAHLDGERAEHALLRDRLVAPRASDLLRAKVARALDAADASASRAERLRVTRWLLPAASVVAAAAALVVFVGVRAPGDQAGAVVHEAVRQHDRQLPLEVQGASTGAWVRQHFEAPSFEPPRFAEPGVRLVGARGTAVPGHDATMLVYEIDQTFRLAAFVVFDVSPEDDVLGRGDDVQVGDRTLRVVQARDRISVTYIDPERHVGYAFIAPGLSGDQLLRLVVSSDLIDRAKRGR